MLNQKEDNSIIEIILNLIQWLKYLKSKWLIIFFSGLLGVVFGFIFSINRNKIYTANLTFALEEKNPGGGINSIASTLGLNIGGNESGVFAGENIIELMKSRLLIEKTLLTKVLINNKEEFLVNRFIDINYSDVADKNNAEIKNKKFYSTDRNRFTREQDSLLGNIQSYIKNSTLEVSKLDKKLSIVSVKLKSKDEIFAKLFCENLVKNVTDFYVETKTGKSKKNVLILSNRVDSVKRELDQAMYGRASFSDQNMSLIKQSAAVPKIKQEMKIQMLSTLYSELVKNLELTKLALMREEPLIQIIDKPILPLPFEKTNRIKLILLGGILSLVSITVFLILYKMFININSYINTFKK